MKVVEGLTAMRVLLIGGDIALLEGLAQAFAAQGYAPRVAATLHEAREAATDTSVPPLLAVVERGLATGTGADLLAIPLMPGGAFMLYRVRVEDDLPVPPAVQRAVLADLTLPLERNRLLALAQHVSDRAIATGRSGRRTPPEQRAI